MRHILSSHRILGTTLDILHNHHSPGTATPRADMEGMEDIHSKAAIIHSNHHGNRVVVWERPVLRPWV